MNNEYEEKVILVCRDLKKPSGSKMAGSHGHGGWDSAKVERAMMKHGLPRRFRPDVMDGLGAGFIPGRAQTVDRDALRQLEDMVNASE